VLTRATFVGGATGPWRVERVRAVIGEALPAPERVLVAGADATAPEALWALRGVAGGHARYLTRAEKTQLDALSPPLDRPEATCAALIPIRKSPEWWSLAQDERRAVFEEETHHVADTLAWLPRIARRLYHAREVDGRWDFLTWFEFAPEHAAAFDELLGLLRERAEWRFVDREVELRLRRD